MDSRFPPQMVFSKSIDNVAFRGLLGLRPPVNDTAMAAQTPPAELELPSEGLQTKTAALTPSVVSLTLHNLSPPADHSDELRVIHHYPHPPPSLNPFSLFLPPTNFCPDYLDQWALEEPVRDK